MDRTTLNTRLERIQNEISKLVNTLYALTAPKGAGRL